MDCPAELGATPTEIPYRSPGPGIGAFSVQELEAVAKEGAGDGLAAPSGWVGVPSPQPTTAAARIVTSVDASRRTGRPGLRQPGTVRRRPAPENRLRDGIGIPLAVDGLGW